MSAAGREQPQQIVALQSHSSNIRNFCILAHVDHGKTTLTDSLISSNGIISAKLAGKLRFLDSTEEEQQRGITMQSSAISLIFRIKSDKPDSLVAEAAPLAVNEEYLINLIDSPGHIDFSSDVSTATRLCDGAIIVVDAVEGICTQTHAVLYKALKERLKPLLVINKIDRLCLEMKLSSTEAFYHLRRLLEQINALSFTLLNSEIMKRREVGGVLQQSTDSSSGAAAAATADEAAVEKSAIDAETQPTKKKQTKETKQQQQQQDEAGSVETVDGEEKRSEELEDSEGEDEKEEEEDALVADWIFTPEQGNVIFASAIDCWGFGVAKFAALWAKRLGVNRNVLRKYIFEDYMFNTATKKIVRCDPARSGSSNGGSSGSGGKPMFASMILDPLWQLYDTAVVQQDPKKLVKMAQKAINIELPPREVNLRDPRATLQSILRRWLPLADAVLRNVVRVVPSPRQAQFSRLFTLLPNVKEADVLDNNRKWLTTIVNDPPTSSYNAQQQQQFATQLVGRMQDPRSEELKVSIAASVDTITRSIASCDTSAAAPLVVFISKMVAMRAAELDPRDLKMLNLQRRAKFTAERATAATGTTTAATAEAIETEAAALAAVDVRSDQEVFLALGRVFSGVLQRNSQLHVLGSRYDPFSEYDATTIQTIGSPSSYSTPTAPTEATTAVATAPGDAYLGLYMMLGPSVFPVQQVPAGNIVAVLGLDEHILKSATLCSTWAAYPMNAITFQAKPMVKVAVEPYSHQHLRSVEVGLKRLHQFDPVVEVDTDSATGQQTMSCLGELHLEQCVKALTERFAKCALKISEPIVAYRETIIHERTDNSSSTNSNTNGSSSGSTSGNSGNTNINASTVAAGAAKYLPPPWGDNAELAAAVNGRYRLLHISDNLAVQIRCFPLPVALSEVLETAAAAGDDARVIAELNASLQLGGSDAIATASQQKLWTQIAAALSTTTSANRFDEELDFIDDALKTASAADCTATDAAVAADLRHRILAVGSRQTASTLLMFANRDVECQIWDQSSLKVPPSATTATLSGNNNSSSNSSNGNISSSHMLHDVSKFLGCVKLSSSTTAATATGAATTVARERQRVFWKLWNCIHSAVVAGFRLVCDAGPLMHEPLHRVGFCIEKIEITKNACVDLLPAADFNLLLLSNPTTAVVSSQLSPTVVTVDSSSSSTGGGNGNCCGGMIITGQLISEVREAMNLCLLSSATRVVEPVYQCDLQCDQMQLGNLYAVLSQRRGSVVSEDVIEGSSLFLLTAHLPLQASFGFAQLLLKKTSGLATAPQLLLSHWSVMQWDPFWRPSTEEELEEFGDLTASVFTTAATTAAAGGGTGGGSGNNSNSSSSSGGSSNLPRVIIDAVRKRKGLPVEEKVVNFAEKQRTLNKKK